jgi:hypothetical protein
MDALLARHRVLTPYLASCVCLSVGKGMDGVAAEAFGAAGVLLFLLALRLYALTNSRPREHWPAPVLHTVRAVLAVAAGAFTWLTTDPGTHRTVMTAVVVAGVAYVVRPYPDWLPPRA